MTATPLWVPSGLWAVTSATADTCKSIRQYCVIVGDCWTTDSCCDNGCSSKYQNVTSSSVNRTLPTRAAAEEIRSIHFAWADGWLNLLYTTTQFNALWVTNVHSDVQLYRSLYTIACYSCSSVADAAGNLCTATPRSFSVCTPMSSFRANQHFSSGHTNHVHGP